jgi:predicted flavoprotein YhiN
MSLGGVFFTPQADPFTISGGSPAVQQNAQFVSRKAVISGGGTLNLTPNQSTAVKLVPPAAILIR